MDLVILAAGIGSRFGCLKQLQPITKNQEFIMDFSIYDAINSGFDRIILIIKKEDELLFKNTIGKRLNKYIEVKYIFQNLFDIPKKYSTPNYRTKPWGTAQALYACRHEITNNFTIINADDFYGKDAFQKASKICKTNLNKTFFLIGYKAINTIPKKNIVKRGICKTRHNYLQEIIESNIQYTQKGIIASPVDYPNNKTFIPNNTVVSMNMWCFSLKIFEYIEKYFIEFLDNLITTNQSTKEFLLPEVIDKMCKNNEIKVKIKNTKAKWQGITYKEDLIDMINFIDKLQEKGIYPYNLFS